ncbi:MAG: serine--tRNA ligase [Deltaproteobacteria bacterium]|nr:serine--tRNA ligase [Deltaproteobacteria bacterium]
MLDIKLIRENPEKVKQALLKRMSDIDFSELLAWDAKRISLRQESDALKAKRSEESSQIPVLKKAGQSTDELMARMKELSDKVTAIDAEVVQIEKQMDDFMVGLPNLPLDDVVAGDKENNEVIKTFGEKPNFSFKAKDHVELVTSLGLIDYERGVKLGGNGFWLYKGKGALMEWALLNYFVEEHLKDGYELILPPHLLNYECGYTAGQFPKFINDVFHIKNAEGEKGMRFLLPTAETALCNIFRDEILAENELPKKYFAYTPCYRKEAGSYRTEERGMIRGHQFNKIEMFQYTRPEASEAAHQELLGKAARLVEGLGLHHRISKLSAGDTSYGMAKTYDVEVWIPSMNDYKELSSVSNGTDYQARRGNMRFKRDGAKKTEFMHTLNASGLATSRIIPAICEQFQQEDGSVIVPQVLRKWVGVERLSK